MEEFGQAVSAAEKVDGPWRQLRPPSGDTLPAEPHLLTHKPPLTNARAEALEEGAGARLAWDFLAQPDPGSGHTKTWRGTEA